jgi:hypothetical protein
MIRKAIFVLCCLGMLTLGCGGATPEPESAANAEDRSSSAVNASGESADSQEDLGLTSDPETTEEVIETSDPLD